MDILGTAWGEGRGEGCGNIIFVIWAYFLALDKYDDRGKQELQEVLKFPIEIF